MAMMPARIRATAASPGKNSAAVRLGGRVSNQRSSLMCFVSPQGGVREVRPVCATSYPDAIDGYYSLFFGRNGRL
jgi:hypothetical protein